MRVDLYDMRVKMYHIRVELNALFFGILVKSDTFADISVPLKLGRS